MDTIVVDGDAVTFINLFELAVVDVEDGTITGSGFGTVDGAKMCIDGDEASVIVGPVGYKTPTHSIAGQGMITVDALGGDQLAKTTTTGDAAVILVGTLLTAKFAVLVPAQQPSAPNPIPDAKTEYLGHGQFSSENAVAQGN